MILGTIDDETGRPYVQAWLYLPRLNVDGWVDLQVDTGADRTVIHPVDVFLLGVNYAQLNGDLMLDGLGGATRNYVEPGFLVFPEENRGLLRVYAVEFVIPPASAHNATFSSLLGRDVIDRWDVRLSRTKRLVRFTVVSADRTVRV